MAKAKSQALSPFMTQLKEKIDVKNIHQLPKVVKVIVAIGIGSIVTRKGLKDFSEFEKNLMKITGQKPQLIKSRKAISNFKLREGMAVMMRVTLRKHRAEDFIKRVSTLILPRIRDFQGLSAKSFDSQANYSFGLKSYELFPEFGLEDVTIPMGIQMSVVCDSRSKDDTKALLETYGLVFQK
jgi:large subunit ribosomal protein L5